AIAALDQIPGIGRRAAEEVLAEIGTDMSGFPSHRHLASWAKVCPGNNQSGGKRPDTAARATAGSRRLWSTAPGAPLGLGAPPSAPVPPAGPPAAGKSALSWPSPTAYW